MRMHETTFEMNLPLALPSVVKMLLDDEKGRRFLNAKLFQASFHVEQDDDSKSIMASKQDPTRTYGFFFRPDCLTFQMEVYSDAIGNPHKFFLQTLTGELRFILSIAKEYLTRAAVSQNDGNRKSGKYID